MNKPTANRRALCIVIAIIVSITPVAAWPDKAFAGGATVCYQIDQSDIGLYDWAKVPDASQFGKHTIDDVQFLTSRTNHGTYSISADVRIYKENGEYGLISSDGVEITQAIYDDVNGILSDGLIGVSKGGKCGYIDITGKVVIPLQYNYAYAFVNGVAQCSLDGKNELYIDKNGNATEVPPQYDDTWAPNVFVPLENKATKDSNGTLECWFVNADGKDVSPQHYSYLEHFDFGVAYIEDKEGNNEIIDKNFNNLFPTLTSLAGVVNIDGTAGGTQVTLDDGNILVYVKGIGFGEIKNPAMAGVDPYMSIVPPIKEPPKSVTATPTVSTVIVNGQNVVFDAYNIDGYNYFKLRDLAYILSGTEKQFSVTWNADSKIIILYSGQPYTADGSEMKSKGGENKTSTPADQKLIINGKIVTLTAYNIDGNNYCKLRDMGKALDFGVGWDAGTSTITIDTSQSYAQ